MQQALLDFFSSLGVSLSADALLVLLAVLFLSLGAVLSWLIVNRSARVKQLALLAQHKTDMETQQQLADDQLDQLSHTFDSLSQKALAQNNSAFLTLAKQNFEQLRIAASGDLQARHQSFEHLVKPIEQSLRKAEEQLKQFELNRRVGDAKLGEQISNLLETQHHLHTETRNLSNALRRPEIRGQWGELTLRRLVELAGLSEHCDFTEQASVATDDGKIRPDMLIHLPNQRQLVVDVKTPLDAFISASESADPKSKDQYLLKHAKNLKQRVIELASKQYWLQFDESPDFVILFIPGDQFLASALEKDPALLEYSLEKRILLATPTSLVGLLRAIAYGWNQDSLNRNSSELKKVGETLARRLSTLTDHLNKLGNQLDQTMVQYNKLVGSFQQTTVPAARRLAELGVNDNATQTAVPQASAGTTARQITSPTPDKPDNDDE